ncbi:MAG: 50S ribosomal protein L4 [Verrucomicrobiota bacterium]|nr:50S ribosomal protein L4 [Verrucomicrobiota bacterium]
MSKTLLVKNKDGKDLGDYDVPENLLEYDKGDHAVHEVVVAYQAHQRAGTASTLSKSKVAGSGKKPWKQKGLGRARAGYKQSPIWRGGAVAHGPHPRSYKKKISKKIAKLAFRRAFSEKVQQNEVILIEDLNLESPKTKELNKIYKNLGIERGCLMVVDEVSQNLFLSSRNIQNVELISADLLNTYKLLLYKSVVVTKAAMNVLEKRLSKESD